MMRRICLALAGMVAVSALCASDVSEAEMKALYEEIKTPYKYGVVLAPDKEKGELFDNPMVFRHGERWYMMFIRFDGKGYETHLAVSDDLLAWKRLGCIFRRGPEGAWDSAQADGWPTLLDMDWNGENRLHTFEGRYWMMYLGGAAHGYETDPLSTGVAWTDDPSAAREWTRLEGNPVMRPSDPDARAFERKTIYKHFTVDDPSRRLGGRFVNFYNAKQQGEWVERIGTAVSDDLRHWKRVGDGPTVSNTGDLDHGICGDPMVRKIGDTYVMFFFGFNWEKKGGHAFDTFAASKDLVHWTKWTGPKLVEASEPWDKGHAHKPWVIKHKGVVYHFYCAVGDRGRCLALATSKPLPAQKVFRAGDRVAWIGDSITSCAHRLPHGYITTIEKAAKETGTPGFDNIIGLGYGGWHVYSWHAYERRSIKEPGLDSRFARVPTLGDVFTNRLDVIVLALGINDHGFPTFPNDDLAPWEAEYDRFISDLRERCHPRQFILCNTTTHTADPGAAANLRLARMNARIAALAKRHGALLIDFRTPAWQAIERVRRMKTGLRDLEDLIHPKEIGHAEMARAFCRAVGETEMVRWLDGEVERRYAALAAKLGAAPRLVCALRPDRTENRPGVQRLAYDIPWNLVGADAAKVSVALPPGWRVIEKTLSPSNGLLRVFGHPTHLVNPVTVTARLKDRVLTETVPIPAPWLVSHDFPFPDAWKGAAWQTNAVPLVALGDVKAWSLLVPTWDFAGDVDPGALDLRSVNTGYPRGAAYVRRQLHAPRAMTLRLVLGTTFWSARNGIRIWCDGKPFAETQLTSGWEKGKPFACKDRAFTLELTPGWHDLVLLTANREFDHYFHCRILDAATGKVPDDLRIACTPDPAVAKAEATLFKHLFFDDQRLYARTNLKRELGRPVAVAKYQDPLYDMPLPPAAVFKCPDGKYRMLYQVYVTRRALNRGNAVGGNPEKVPTRRRAALALAVSDDGLSFRPDTPHIVSDAWGELGSSDEGDLGEVAFVIEDAKAPAAERYKIFGCTNEMEFRHGRGNYMLASGDLKSWRRIEGAQWHDVGTEPITSCFWNEAQDAYTVLLRPQAGERRVGWSLTKDFRTFTKPQFCMQCDPEDEPLAELYGAFGFAYDGWHLAMPLLFGGQPSEMRGKGRMGTMTPQLAYSMNGLNFQRVFHKAFLDGGDPSLVALTGTKCPMIWPGTVRRDADGSILLHTVCCGFDHGGFYRANRNTWIVAWRLREDGFVRLVSEDPAKESVLGTRDILWRGGELRVNLACRDRATVAVYASEKPGGLLAPVPGYGHADCAPFTGDSTAWTPTWRGGSLEAFKGRRIAFELRFRDGEVYSLSGNMTPMMWVQVQQYEEACVDPTRPGW